MYDKVLNQLHNYIFNLFLTPWLVTSNKGVNNCVDQTKIDNNVDGGIQEDESRYYRRITRARK